MKLGVLFSGGKDSTYAALLAKRADHDLVCFLSIESENQDSFMFHTPTINLAVRQAELCGVPFLSKITKGEKEKELEDLKDLIEEAVAEYNIEGIVTGAVESVYQASRVQKICNELDIECFNPLWQKDQIELLEDLIKNDFKIIVSAVAGYPLDDKWVGRVIDNKFIEEIIQLNKKFDLNPAGEGGEFETLVVNCPLFFGELEIDDIKVSGEGNSYRGEVELK